ncbi:MAG: hypothetical protein K2Q01_03310 [Rickettsiales bacterium]|nr:hypothetical protein [Rickettsiales bacterium]
MSHVFDISYKPSSEVNPSGYRYSGYVALEGELYDWRKAENGEILVAKRQQKQTFVTLGALGLLPEQEKQLVNGVVAQHRPHAMPDMNGYYAASAVVTEHGHLFVGTNNEVHIKDPYAGRGCGETTALRYAQDGLHDPHVMLRSMYLMSGVATRDALGFLTDKEPGHVGCMCGECRDNARRHTRAETEFVFLPTGDGTAKLRINRDAQDPGELKPGEAWAVSQARMYPVPEHVEVAGKNINQKVRDGYAYITDKRAELRMPESPLLDALIRGEPLTDAQKQELAHAFARVNFTNPVLEETPKPTLTNINRTLVNRIKDAYGAHAHRVGKEKPIRITALLLKGDDGHFYTGVSVVGEGWLPSKAPEFTNALTNANNHIGFTEVYMMTFDSQQVLGEMSAGVDAKQSHVMRLPKPDGLGRLIKNLKPDQNPPITIFAINDGSLSEAELKECSHTLLTREAFGPDYLNPKKIIHRQGVH